MTSVTAATEAAPRTTGRQWTMVIVLTFVYVLNFLDRQLLSILAKPIQDTLHISDGDLGKLGGLYFAFFYCFIAIPVGWLADRTNRVNILSLACAVWSGATIACGMAATYPQLVAARMTVGFGEAGGVPPSYALITDTFPPGRRGMAFGIFNLGPPIGAALGIAFGASIAALFNWRDAFVIIGGIGIVTALLIKVVIREPKRGATDTSIEHAVAEAAIATAPPRAPFWGTLGMFVSHPILMLASLGSGATQFVTYGLGNFAVLFLMREKGMTLNDVAVWYALVVLVGMGGSMLVCGRILDHFTRKSRTAYAMAPALSLCVSMPFYVGFVWAPSWPLALVLLTITNFFNYFYLSASVALVQDEVQPNQRVLSGALLLLVMNFIGLGLGPTFVGWLSDTLKDAGYEHTLQLALYAITPFYLIAIVLFLMLARILRAERKVAA